MRRRLAAVARHRQADGGGGARAAKLGTIKRSDGVSQVTYAGHPLYLYVGDANPGDTNGERSTAFGAAWLALSGSGSAVMGSSASTGSKGG